MTIKMFIKRKNRIGKAYAYQILVGFSVLRHLQLHTGLLDIVQCPVLIFRPAHIPLLN